LPNSFLDTSALAKRYHKEHGSEYVDRMLEQPASRLLISHLSIVELESVLAIKTRTEINRQALEIAGGVSESSCAGTPSRFTTRSRAAFSERKASVGSIRRDGRASNS